MARRIVIRPQAVRDILQQAAYLARQGSPAVARRFQKAVAATLTWLAGMPEAGTPYEVEHPRLGGLRCWPVRRFENYLVFYLVSEDSVEVVRMLHGARDIDGLLENY